MKKQLAVIFCCPYNSQANPIEQKKEKKTSKVYDLWEAPVERILEVIALYVEKYDSKGFLKKEDFEIRMKKRKTVVSHFFLHSQPRQVVTPNNFPAVEIPKAGASYNPDKEQHQDLLGEQLAMELSYEEEIERRKQLPGGMTLDELHAQKVQPDILSVFCLLLS